MTGRKSDVPAWAIMWPMTIIGAVAFYCLAVEVLKWWGEA